MTKLFEHKEHTHKPMNVNWLHATEQATGGFNKWIAVLLTSSVGSMWTAYLFVLIALAGLLAILGVFTPIVALLVAWASQTFIQLVLLPVIMVGQNVLNRKQELQADETFATTQHSFYDIEQVAQHLDTQDQVLLQILSILTREQPK